MKGIMTLLLLGALGAGGYYAWMHYLKPEARVCRKLESLCGATVSKEPDECTRSIADLRVRIGEDGQQRLDSCMSEAQSCSAVMGCMAGASLSGVGGAMEEFLKGLSKGAGK